MNAIPILFGLIFVGAAVTQRGWKTFLEKKKEDPKLEFNAAYMLNFIAAGTVSTAIISAITALLTLIPEQTVESITLYGMISNAILGYTTAYTILDQLNTGTEKSFKLQDANHATETPSP